MERYVASRASYYEVLQQQQQLFPAENALVQLQLNQRLALVQLYQAFGGGFGFYQPETTVKLPEGRPGIDYDSRTASGLGARSVTSNSIRVRRATVLKNFLSRPDSVVRGTGAPSKATRAPAPVSRWGSQALTQK